MDADGQGLAGVSDATPAEVSGLYDAWVPSYDADVLSWGYAIPGRLASAVRVAGAIDGEILDAGCGTGLVGRALRSAGATSIVGCDFSAESLAVAEREATYRELQLVDLNQPLPFASQRFAAVTCGGVFSYLADPAGVLDEFVRITVSGGIIVFTQRVDLWAPRHMDDVLAALAATGRCAVAVSPPLPYLPDHGEFDDGVHDVTVTVA